jgi:hypothetical protein
MPRGWRPPARGEDFCDMALLHQARRNATVRCVETMDVLALPEPSASSLHVGTFDGE